MAWDACLEDEIAAEFGVTTAMVLSEFAAASDAVADHIDWTSFSVWEPQRKTKKSRTGHPVQPPPEKRAEKRKADRRERYAQNVERERAKTRERMKRWCEWHRDEIRAREKERIRLKRIARIRESGQLPLLGCEDESLTYTPPSIGEDHERKAS